MQSPASHLAKQLLLLLLCCGVELQCGEMLCVRSKVNITRRWSEAWSRGPSSFPDRTERESSDGSDISPPPPPSPSTSSVSVTTSEQRKNYRWARGIIQRQESVDIFSCKIIFFFIRQVDVTQFAVAFATLSTMEKVKRDIPMAINEDRF